MERKPHGASARGAVDVLWHRPARCRAPGSLGGRVLVVGCEPRGLQRHSFGKRAAKYAQFVRVLAEYLGWPVRIGRRAARIGGRKQHIVGREARTTVDGCPPARHRASAPGRSRVSGLVGSSLPSKRHGTRDGALFRASCSNRHGKCADTTWWSHGRTQEVRAGARANLTPMHQPNRGD